MQEKGDFLSHKIAELLPNKVISIVLIANASSLRLQKLSHNSFVCRNILQLFSVLVLR